MDLVAGTMVGFSVVLALALGQEPAAEQKWDRAMTQAQWLQAAGRSGEAALKFRDATEAARQFDAGGRAEVLALNGLASAYAESGEMLNAEDAYRRALRTLERTEGRTTADYAVVLGSLAAVYAEEGDVVRGERAVRESIEVLKGVVAPSDERLTVQRLCLAQLLTLKKDYREAAGLLEEAREAIGRNSAQAVPVLNSLGVVRLNEGRPEDAASLFESALEMSGEGTAWTGRLLSNLATAHARTGHVREAGKTFQRALAVHEQRKVESSAYGVLLQNYAVFLEKTGSRALARRYRERARGVLESAARVSGKGLRVDVSALAAR